MSTWRANGCPGTRCGLPESLVKHFGIFDRHLTALVAPRFLHALGIGKAVAEHPARDRARDGAVTQKRRDERLHQHEQQRGERPEIVRGDAVILRIHRIDEDQAGDAFGRLRAERNGQ